MVRLTLLEAYSPKGTRLANDTFGVATTKARPSRLSASRRSRTPSSSSARSTNAVTTRPPLTSHAALLDHINPYGSYTFDVDRELQRTGRRPLRPAIASR
jgi:hypothetical protein